MKTVTFLLLVVGSFVVTGCNSSEPEAPMGVVKTIPKEAQNKQGNSGPRPPATRGVD